MLDKSRGLSVDCVAYDLEDSVSLNRKDEARQRLRRFLEEPAAPGINEVAVRINSVDSGLAEKDLAHVCNAPTLKTIVIPKVSSPADLTWAADFLAHKSSQVKILALIESAKSLSNLTSICRATPLLSGLIFAAEDFALDLSLTRTPSLTEFLYARSAIVTAARAHDIPSTIDLVCTDFKGEQGRQRMEEECLGGKRLGFNGKQCIHPNQVGIAQEAFAPAEEEVEWAVRVGIANEKAEKQGKGAWALDGKMIDVPVVRKARGIVAKAEQCGHDVDAIKARWGTQEPE
ncbi:MAG: hypothetical protein OHK93_001622 [Ramalina farinacea]|uniref:HpcH/HpaI aldolase/citrate lyase domain-containing protein n=1 Tax=Ramalina farinacea TaxID=258253 RepID=A0AA43QRK7_9LECA|nr:hypothetical protein [Ramalina farinacea]